MSEEVELLQQLIRNACINDGGPDVSERANADVVLGILEASGVDVDVLDAAPGRRSVLARLPGDDPDAPTLMLLGHTDVVPAPEAGWREDPFGGALVDGFIWGRGALDMLGHVATMTLAVRDHARQGRRRRGDVVLALVADEEALGTFGMGWLQEHAPDHVRADWVVTETGGVPSGPATDRRLSVLAAEKGAWRVTLRIEGVPGHGSMPPLGPTSLDLAAQVITRLSAHRPQVVITEPWREFVRAGWDPAVHEALTEPALVDVVVDVLPDAAARTAHALTRMTMVPTSVRSPSSWNTVPGTVEISVDVRTLPGQDRADVLDALSQALGDLAPRVAIDVVTGMPATSTPSGGRLWQVLQKAADRQTGGSRLIPTLAPGATDARFLRQRGAAALGFGLMSDTFPAHEIPTMLHGVDERIDVTSLSMMRRLWTDVLDLHAEETRD